MTIPVSRDSAPKLWYSSPERHEELVVKSYIFLWGKLADTKKRQGISPLCFTPQQAVTACRQSTTLQSLCSVWLAASLTQLLHLLSGSTAFRNLSEHLISTSWLCFPPWWLACVWILTRSTRAISACHSQSSCQLWTEYDFEDCHVL